jgi:hypothetical protein
MLQRVVQLREEIAKWEADEAERQRVEAMRAKRQAAGTPSMRPLMIRTGKAKTDGERLRGTAHALEDALGGPLRPSVPNCRHKCSAVCMASLHQAFATVSQSA